MYSPLLYRNQIHVTTCGTKISNPTITEAIAAIRTAPAAVSLAIFAKGFFSSVARSTTASTAVLTSSNDRTRAHMIMQIHHSTTVSFATIPAIRTKTYSELSYFALCGFRSRYPKTHIQNFSTADFFCHPAYSSSPIFCSRFSAPLIYYYFIKVLTNYLVFPYYFFYFQNFYFFQISIDKMQRIVHNENI